MKTRILIAGIGGVGGYFGGLLAKSFENSNEVEIIFLARSEHLKMIQQNGLKVITKENEFIAKPFLVTDDANKIGVMGFSAGGHLAASLATHYADVKINNPENLSLRPDFQILIYPVISFQNFGHGGSRNNLIGPVMTEEAIHYFSNEEQINAYSPPAFLVHAKDDDAVPVLNSTIYAKTLEMNKVPAEIYLYEKGGHGFGMKNPTSEVYWPNLLKDWLHKKQIL